MQTDAYTWGRMHWLVDDFSHENPEFTLARMVVFPASRSEMHTHLTCNEALFVMQGSCTIHNGGKDTPLQEGDHLYIPKGVAHAVNNTSATTTLELLLTYSQGTRDYQRV